MNNGASAAAEAELATALAAAKEGNEGKARVCARRAVAAVLQRLASSLSSDPGPNALANLRWVRDDAGTPPDIRDAAERLLGGARSIVSGERYSTDPIDDARRIVRHFLGGDL